MELFYQDQDQAAPLYRQKTFTKSRDGSLSPPTVIFLMAIWFILLITTHYLHNHMPLIKDCLQTTGNFPKYVPSCYTVQLSHVDICSDRKVPSNEGVIMFLQPSDITVRSIYLANEWILTLLCCDTDKKKTFTISHSSYCEYSESIAKKSIFGPIVPSHQLLTELH